MSPSQTIIIDNQEYALDSLSDAAKQHLTNLRFVDQEITHLQIQLRIAQTARAVYASSVKSSLPVTVTSGESAVAAE